MRRSDDPIRDFYRHDAEEQELLEKCPVCDCCGEPITDETFKKIVYRGKTLRFHDDCIETRYTEDYITREEI